MITITQQRVTRTIKARRRRKIQHSLASLFPSTGADGPRHVCLRSPKFTGLVECQLD